MFSKRLSLSLFLITLLLHLHQKPKYAMKILLHLQPAVILTTIPTVTLLIGIMLMMIAVGVVLVILKTALYCNL